MGERWLRIKEMLGLLWLCQLQTTTAAIATAALIFDRMTGAFQGGEQGLAALQFKAAARRDERRRGVLAHRLNPSRSPALSSLSI